MINNVLLMNFKKSKQSSTNKNNTEDYGIFSFLFYGLLFEIFRDSFAQICAYNFWFKMNKLLNLFSNIGLNYAIIKDYQPPLSPSLSASLYFSKSKLYKSGALCAPPLRDSSNLVRMS